MKYYMPVKIYDESDCVSRHTSEFAALGKRALIVTGKRSAFANGSFDDVTAALEKEGIKYLVFSDVEENPSTDTVFSASQKFAPEGPDFVIGVGGGSAMDAAKAIALVLKHPEADLDYLYDTSKDPSAVPVVCVPTTGGTGSEATGVSVLTRHDRKTKMSMVHKVFPTLALIDGKYLRSASQTLIINSAVDALSHLYESVLNAKADDYVRMTAAAGLRTWAMIRNVLTGEEEADDHKRSLLMRSSTLAGMSIAQSGTTLPHTLSYIITYDLGMAHGRAVGYFLPGYMAAAPEKESRELLNMSGFADVAQFGEFIARVFDDPKIPVEELNKTYESTRLNQAKMKSASFTVDDDILHKMVFGF